MMNRRKGRTSSCLALLSFLNLDNPVNLGLFLPGCQVHFLLISNSG